jgi:predicted nucleic-acid-binding protein
MIAVDTNIVVRFLTQDDATQYKKAYQLFDDHDIFIADTVILETEWVLRFAYHFDAKHIAEALTKLFGLPNVHINHPSLLAQAIEWHLQGLDFADAFHLANSQQCKTFLTFDEKMINAAKNIDTCQVLAP